MGLMYIFPAQEDEIERISKKETSNGVSITLKTYGLPMIFWGYLAAALAILLFMFIGIKATVFKMIAGADQINALIAYAVILLFLFGPITLLGFFFYEKQIHKMGQSLKVTHYIFWIPFYTKKYQLKSSDSFTVTHHLASPNIAKMKSDPELRGFETKGYFELWIELENDETKLLDRHSRKIDLTKIAELLSKY